MRAVAGRQPKASKTPPLVSEYKHTISIVGPNHLIQNPPCACMARNKQPWDVPQCFGNSIPIIPAESQLLRISQTRSKGGDNLVDDDDGINSKKPFAKLIWGIPWDCESFVSQAVAKGHPRAYLAHCYQKSYRMLLRKTVPCPAKTLLNFVPAGSKSGFPEPKPLLPKLTGSVPLTGVFDPSFKPALLTEDELFEQSSESNKAIYQSVHSSGADEVDSVVFQKTLEERDAGWLRGPIPFRELGRGCVLSRRFGLKQPNKVRLIDDLSKSHINATVQTPEAPRPRSTDVIASLALALLLDADGRKVLGKTFDLKSAYRQLGIHPNSLACSYIACFDPVSRGPAVFQMLAVRFGGSRSVYSFLRIVRFVWWIACKCLAVMRTNFL